jgi:hypothetical protein
MIVNEPALVSLCGFGVGRLFVKERIRPEGHLDSNLCGHGIMVLEVRSAINTNLAR